MLIEEEFDETLHKSKNEKRTDPKYFVNCFLVSFKLARKDEELTKMSQDKDTYYSSDPISFRTLAYFQRFRCKLLYSVSSMDCDIQRKILWVKKLTQAA